MELQDYMLRDLKKYDLAIEEILEVIAKHNMTFIETYGILEAVKEELMFSKGGCDED